MGYIIKDTSALINSVITDAGRRAISRGNFNISYFQVGDSEVCYDCIENADLTTLNILSPQPNAQNKSPLPEKNQMNIKYPMYVDSSFRFPFQTNTTPTFGIPFSNPQIDEIYNSASPRGFFTGETGSFYHNTTSAYTKSSNWVVDLTTLSSGYTFIATYNSCSTSFSANTAIGDYVSIWMDGAANCNTWSSNFPMLMYRVEGITGDTTGTSGTVIVQVDRRLPDLSSMSYTGNGRCHFFPSGMTEMYDSNTPLSYLETEELNFEKNCFTGLDVKIWNMNIPWTESPAGFTVNDRGYENFGSTGYTGTKEYLGYNSNIGQTDTSSTYYYDSFSEKINLLPSDQKSIAIIHYTNNALDNFYGEKIAQKARDTSVALSADTGAARNFKIDIPWLMWHKSSGGNMGESFFTDPDGYDGLNLFTPHYIKSIPNLDMNEPGIRYYHIWDTNTNSNGFPNRVGKLFPDLKIAVIDDDELVAAMNYKSNRNWTLPAPKLSLIAPNTFNNEIGGLTGVLSGTNECMWVTYRMNSSAFTNSLHCNYYTKICGTDPDCPPDTANVLVKFGSEFQYLNSDPSAITGFSANEFVILAQKVVGDARPDPASWVQVTGITEQLSATTSNGLLTKSGLTRTTLQITKESYEGGSAYVLENYIDLPQTGDTQMNFGDEYFFYGTISADIQATIYVMNYQVNLGQTQFLESTNPTWDGTDPYVTEIGLYNSDKDLMIISKVQSPEQRVGVQQYNIRFDF